MWSRGPLPSPSQHALVPSAPWRLCGMSGLRCTSSTHVLCEWAVRRQLPCTTCTRVFWAYQVPFAEALGLVVTAMGRRPR